jgi:hypothetical protein
MHHMLESQAHLLVGARILLLRQFFMAQYASGRDRSYADVGGLAGGRIEAT